MRFVTEAVVREALALAAAEHGHVLNKARFARQLHLSIPSVNAILRAMASMGWIRLLPALRPPGSRRCFRKARIQLTSAPVVGRIFGPGHELRARAVSVVESIMQAERGIDPQSRFLHFGVYELRSLDLVVERAGERTGYLFLEGPEPLLRHLLPLRRAVKQRVVRRGFVLHTGERCYFAARDILAVPAELFVARYEDFTGPQDRYERWHILCYWVNDAWVGDETVSSIVRERPRIGARSAEPDIASLADRLWHGAARDAPASLGA